MEDLFTSKCERCRHFNNGYCIELKTMTLPANGCVEFDGHACAPENDIVTKKLEYYMKRKLACDIFVMVLVFAWFALQLYCLVTASGISVATYTTIYVNTAFTGVFGLFAVSKVVGDFKKPKEN